LNNFCAKRIIKPDLASFPLNFFQLNLPLSRQFPGFSAFPAPRTPVFAVSAALENPY